MIKLSTRSTTLSNVQKSTSNSQARSLSLDELEKVTGGVRCFVKSWSTSGAAASARLFSGAVDVFAAMMLLLRKLYPPTLARLSPARLINVKTSTMPSRSEENRA